MARSKNRKKKSKSPQQVKLKPENYIRKVGRKLPVHECLIDENWKKEGFSPVIISRKRANGNMIACTYLVDLYCLGVKETMFIHDIDPYSYEENIKQMGESMGLSFVKIDPMLAFNIIYGAVEYAEDLGFDPHKDFTKTTEYLLDEVSTIEYMEIEFGKDGKPFFVAGPYDNSEQIYATLKKNVGEGNFEFIAHFDQNELYMDNYDEVELGNLTHFFPVDKMAKKEESLKGENLLLWDMQVTIAIEALRLANGKIENIDPFWSNEEEDYFGEVLDAVFRKLEEVKIKNGQDLEEEEEGLYEFVERYTVWVMEKLIDLKGTQFLYDPNYEPMKKDVSVEQIEKMNDKEFAAFEKESEFYRTKEESNQLLFAQVFLRVAGEKFTEEEMLLKENQEKAIELYLKRLAETFERELTKEQIKYYTAITKKPLALLKEST